MANGPDDLVIRILREIQGTLSEHTLRFDRTEETLTRIERRMTDFSTGVMPGQRAGHPFRRPSNRDDGGMDCRVRPGNDGHIDGPES